MHGAHRNPLNTLRIAAPVTKKVVGYVPTSYIEVICACLILFIYNNRYF